MAYSTSIVHQSAAKALGKIGDRRAVEPLIKALEDENEFVRFDAAKALGDIGDKRAVEPLIEMLKDKHRGVGSQASEALGNIGDKRAVEPLRTIVSFKYGEIRESAREALEKLGHMTEDTSPENLRKVDVSDIKIGPSGEISINEVMHLERMRDSHAIELLIESLKNRTDSENRDYNISSRDSNQLGFTGSAVFPRAEVSTGTKTKCLASHTTIQEGELRIAVEKISLDSDLYYYINVGYIRATYFEEHFKNPKYDSDAILLQANQAKDNLMELRYLKRDFPREHITGHPEYYLFLDTEDWENTVYTLIENSQSKTVISTLPNFDQISTRHRKKTYSPLAKDKLHELNELFGRTAASYNHIINTLVEITEKKIKEKEKQNILKFLKSDDQEMVLTGASMLKELLE